MNFSQYLLEVTYTHYNNQELRYGQTCYNVLHEINPEAAEEITGTFLDPFHDDAGVPEFLRYVRGVLDE